MILEMSFRWDASEQKSLLFVYDDERKICVRARVAQQEEGFWHTKLVICQVYIDYFLKAFSIMPITAEEHEKEFSGLVGIQKKN